MLFSSLADQLNCTIKNTDILWIYITNIGSVCIALPPLKVKLKLGGQEPSMSSPAGTTAMFSLLNSSTSWLRARSVDS
jgi:hypothetical protein